MADQLAGTEGETPSTAGTNPQTQGGEPAASGGEAPASNGQDTGSTLLGATPEPQQSGQEAASGGAGQPETPSGPILDMLGDNELKQDPSLQQIQSVEDLAKGYVHAQKLVGKDKIPLPKDENDTDAWNDVLKKLGRPNDPSEYQLPELSEDSAVQLPEGMDNWFKNKAHELGLTNKQARELWSGYISDVAENQVQQQTQQAQQQKEQAEAELKKEFGNAFDEKLQDARTALKQYDTDGSVTKALEQSGLGNNPAVVKMLSQIGEAFREDKVGGSSKSFSRTPQQAQQEIQDLRMDKNFMQQWMDPKEPGHNSAVAKMSALYQEAYPSG
jgi:hypothetical protein